MKYCLLITFLILCSCGPKEVDWKEYKVKVNEFCEPCGGVKTAFINAQGNEVMCVDGTSLSQTWSSTPTVLLLGKCK